MQNKSIILLGPWGGNGGTKWDDGTYHGVREITIVYDRCIDLIRVVYDKNGKSIPAEKLGGLGGNLTAECMVAAQLFDHSHSGAIKGPLGHLESKKEPHFLSQWMGA
nr:jacalin-related lectin 19 [Quercus suber]